MEPQKTEVLICGSGSAGLCAASWLARYDIPCKILESRGGPLLIGKADGVQCRTVEIFESFGMVEELLREACWIVETVFWSDGGDGNIVRTRRTADTMPGLSHMPHVILNQARINGLFLEAMQRFNGQGVEYGYQVKGVVMDGDEEYPVTVNAEKDGVEEAFQAKYVLACDGAHSVVRKSLGFKMIGDSTDAVWGVMDIYPQTDFPDIRKKTAIMSQSGTLLIIPREGGSLARFYIELPPGTVARDVKLEDLHSAARHIFHPYKMDFADTFWWSAYSIGQRLADFFSKDDRIFLTGDACHTHSPKAGQGMNTSLQDGYNIGWKLASILKGQIRPEVIRSYNIEREKVAADLISFDRELMKLFASKSPNGVNGDLTKSSKYSEWFIKSAKFTAGLTATYGDSMVISMQNSKQSLARNIQVGMRFPSAQVVRFCDAKAMQLAKALPADGRWRLVVFAGDIRDPVANARLEKLGRYLNSEDGPIRTFTPVAEDIDSFIEVVIVLTGERISLEQEQIPNFFWPVTGKWRMRDLHKVYIDDESYNSGHGKAYEFYGVEPEEGALAVVRPDQYVSMVTAIDEHQLIKDFFSGFAIPRT